MKARRFESEILLAMRWQQSSHLKFYLVTRVGVGERAEWLPPSLACL